MGLIPDEFWSMTFTEIELACKGYETRMARVKEVPRIIAAILINQNRKKGSAPIQIEKIIPLYTDKRTKELMTKEEYLDLLEFRKKIVWENKDWKQN